MVRIRKNLQVSPLLYCSNAAAEDFQPHICHLNQSRWDVSPLPEREAEGDLDVNGSGTIGATKSVALPSQMDIDKVIMDVEEGEEVGDGSEIGFQKKRICQKNDGKKWNCRNEVKEEYSYCKHHLTLIRGYHNNSSNKTTSNAPKSSTVKKPRVAPVMAPEAKAKKGSSSKPDDFVYYSIFSPTYGNNRRKKAEEEVAKSITVEIGAATSSTNASTPEDAPPSPKADFENQFASMDVNEKKDDGSNSCGRKRRRKMKRPVKASSL
ncbi:uncharacterized protein LOC126803635 [Argentina anserina]|uniref:uncharacterized protein LOC126803635 n=1 Tax=Argentina anserina TaxID=57926 RepID=UPI002176693A|nr:uncharacterized protein LOC126803635 [Potentilla anserina]